MIVYASDPDSGLTFHEPTHEYQRHGVPLMSVTQALNGACLVDTQWFTAASRERGRMVHEALALDARQELDHFAFGAEHPELAGYVAGALKWLETTGVVRDLSEIRACDTARDEAGTIDLVGWRMNRGRSRRVVVDWKTGALQFSHWIQLAEYIRLARQLDPTAVWDGVLVQLSLTGEAEGHDEPPLPWHTLQQHFSAALVIARLRRQHGLSGT